MEIWCEDVLMHGCTWPNHARYQQACDAAFRELSLASGFRAFSEDVPTVICVARNEECRLPIFLEHYRKLGVESIHVVDNSSSDRTAEIARSYSSVTLWNTGASYAGAGFGQLWIGAIVRRHGMGRWVLNVDADELFVYAGMGSKSLRDFQYWLDCNEQERLFTPLIDLYPSATLSQTNPIAGVTTQLLFDGRLTHSSSYRYEDSPFGPKLVGGPRARMMNAIGMMNSPWLSKFALARWDQSTAYANVHFPYPFDRNARHCCGALLHLKLLEDFSDRVSSAISDGEHYNSAEEYKLYRRWLGLETSGVNALVSADISVVYDGPSSLVTAGIIDPVPQ